VRHYPHLGECTLLLRVLAVACTMRNEALRSVTGCYGSVTGLMERYGSVAVGTLWNFTERLDVTESYGTVTENIDFARH